MAIRKLLRVVCRSFSNITSPIRADDLTSAFLGRYNSSVPLSVVAHGPFNRKLASIMIDNDQYE